LYFHSKLISENTAFGISLHLDDGTFPGKLVRSNATIDVMMEKLALDHLTASLDATAVNLTDILASIGSDALKKTIGSGW
jgi:hypothetical protein